MSEVGIFKRLRRRVKRAVTPPKQVRRFASRVARKLVHPRVRKMYDDAYKKLPPQARPALKAMLIPGLGVIAAQAIVTVQLAKYAKNKVTRSKSKRKIVRAKQSARRGSPRGASQFSHYRKANVLSRAAATSRTPRSALSKYKRHEKTREVKSARRGASLKRRGMYAAKSIVAKRARGRTVTRRDATSLLNRLKGRAVKRAIAVKVKPKTATTFKPRGSSIRKPVKTSAKRTSMLRSRPSRFKRRGLSSRMFKHPSFLKKLAERKVLTPKPAPKPAPKSALLKSMTKPPVPKIPKPPKLTRPPKRAIKVRRRPLPPPPPPMDERPAPIMPLPMAPLELKPKRILEPEPLAPLPPLPTPEPPPFVELPPPPPPPPMLAPAEPAPAEYYPEEEYYDEEYYDEEEYAMPEPEPAPQPVEEEAWPEEQYYEDEDGDAWYPEDGDEDYYASDDDWEEDEY